MYAWKVQKYFQVNGREELGDINIDRIILTWMHIRFDVGWIILARVRDHLQVFVNIKLMFTFIKKWEICGLLSSCLLCKKGCDLYWITSESEVG